MSTCGRSVRLCTVTSHRTDPRDDEGPRPHEGTRAWAEGLCREGAQRQRIDMTRPATIAPKPMAKFHADSDTMNGMRSPAT